MLAADDARGGSKPAKANKRRHHRLPRFAAANAALDGCSSAGRPLILLPL
jgi:hypothetical protein